MQNITFAAVQILRFECIHRPSPLCDDDFFLLTKYLSFTFYPVFIRVLVRKASWFGQLDISLVLKSNTVFNNNQIKKVK